MAETAVGGQNVAAVLKGRLLVRPAAVIDGHGIINRLEIKEIERIDQPLQFGANGRAIQPLLFLVDAVDKGRRPPLAQRSPGGDIGHVEYAVHF